MRSRSKPGVMARHLRIGRQQQLISVMLRELQVKDYVTDSARSHSFLQAAIRPSSRTWADASADTSLVAQCPVEDDRTKHPVCDDARRRSYWDPNRRIAAEPMARQHVDRARQDKAPPVGADLHGWQRRAAGGPRTRRPHRPCLAGALRPTPRTPVSPRAPRTIPPASVENNEANEAAQRRHLPAERQMSTPPRSRPT